MGKIRETIGSEMATKPKPLGYNAMEKVDNALMANAMLRQKLSAILTNELTTVEIVKLIGVAIHEAGEVQQELTELKYLGK